MSTCSPQELMDSAACFACLPEDQKQTLKLQLLCEILNAGGGGGGGVTSIIAGEGISVDQATGDVTVTATGGGGPEDIYWLDNNDNTGPTIDVFAIGGTYTDITGSLPGWTGTETAAFLAAIQAGKTIQIALQYTVDIHNSGVGTMGGGFQMQYGGVEDGTNRPPNTQGSTVTLVSAITDASANGSTQLTANFSTDRTVSVSGSDLRPNPDGTANFAVCQSYPMAAIDGSYAAIYDGLIYLKADPSTNVDAISMTIQGFRVTVLNP